MRLFKSFLVALTVVFAAGSAAALVTVNHTTVSPTSNIAVGDLVLVQVRVTWDGQGALNGIFSSSSSSNASVMVADSATNGATMYRGSLFAYSDEETGESFSLSRFGQGQLRQAVDGPGVVRSVQYGSLTPVSPLTTAKTNVLITTITFRAVAPGTTNIGYFLALGDTGAQGDSTAAGAPITVTVVPEPGTALLMGLGLAGLGLAGRRS